MSKFIKPQEAEGIIAFLEAYQSLMEADDPYFADNYEIYDHKGKLKAESFSGHMFETEKTFRCEILRYNTP